jgi:hypothetical protein
MKIVRALLLALIAVGIILSGAWVALALVYAARMAPALAIAVAAVPALIAIGLLFRPRWRWHAAAGYAALFAVVMAWWSTIQPSNERDWQPDVAVPARADIDGDVVTLRNIRNFDYRTEFDYTPRYYDRRFDLNRMTGVDLIAVYWMGPAIAHIFLSFEFDHRDHVAISIETRKEKDEGYSTLKGFFRQYELFYVVADERDVIRLRTHFRQDPPEQVYVYRLAGNLDKGRRLFMEYMRHINALYREPEFYNTLTTNCTTSIWLNNRVNQKPVPLHWKILVSGYLPEYLYEKGRLQTDGLSFAALQRHAHVNDRVRSAGDAADYSARIRMAMESR